jgi:starch synthase
MKINIVTTSRFHIATLAFEMAELGHQVTLYSTSPKSILQKYAGNKVKICSLFLFAAPFLALARVFRLKSVQEFSNKGLILLIDTYTSLFMKSCDVFIGMSGISKFSMRSAKTKFSALTILERSSQHILSQKKILQELKTKDPKIEQVNSWIIDRELYGYSLCDFIAVPSLVVKKSFLEQDVPEAKLFLNPFGVSLSEFKPQSIASNHQPTAIMTGSWSYRKGSDLLEKVWPLLKTNNAQLIHVGSVLDCPFPEHSKWLTHFDHVPQSLLNDFYAKAHIQILLSREEGLAVVQAQGLQCGLVLVCTDRTGGEDLQNYVSAPERILVVHADDIQAIAAAIDQAFEIAFRQNYNRLLPMIQSLSWADYAKRYEAFLIKNIAAKKAN